MMGHAAASSSGVTEREPLDQKAWDQQRGCRLAQASAHVRSECTTPREQYAGSYGECCLADRGARNDEDRQHELCGRDNNSTPFWPALSSVHCRGLAQYAPSTPSRTVFVTGDSTLAPPAASPRAQGREKEREVRVKFCEQQDPAPPERRCWVLGDRNLLCGLWSRHRTHVFSTSL